MFTALHTMIVYVPINRCPHCDFLMENCLIRPNTKTIYHIFLLSLCGVYVSCYVGFPVAACLLVLTVSFLIKVNQVFLCLQYSFPLEDRKERDKVGQKKN